MESEALPLVGLQTLRVGDCAVVRRVNSPNSNLRRRLLEMGLVTGSKISLVRFAPLGDPLEISLRGYRLSLRKEEASRVLVERIVE
ncbi:MAG: ferrous iron transport protein A [Ignavibacteriales bacterium]|nr:ferrous iron transport protein A [Ignavibacteriales bacterium]